MKIILESIVEKINENGKRKNMWMGSIMTGKKGHTFIAGLRPGEYTYLEEIKKRIQRGALVEIIVYENSILVSIRK